MVVERIGRFKNVSTTQVYKMAQFSNTEDGERKIISNPFSSLHNDSDVIVTVGDHSKKEPEIILFLYLSEEYDMPQLKSLLLKHDYDSTFAKIKSYDQWKDLTIQSKYVIIQKRLKFLILSDDRRFRNITVKYSGNSYFCPKSTDEEYTQIATYLRKTIDKVNEKDVEEIEEDT